MKTGRRPSSFSRGATSSGAFSLLKPISVFRCFLDHPSRDPITGEIGKTICFAVSRRHATKLVTLLNEEATRRWPEVYGAGSTFAVQVTSDQPAAQQMTLDFANNNLNGKSKWRAAEFRDYDTSRTRVCVTVGIMTTGYDCEDLLNVVLARPILSPTDFIQIKGRGTRLFTFKHHDGTSERTAAKDGFALFDFFANCEFFEEDFDYDQKLNLPKSVSPTGPDTDTGGTGGAGSPKPAKFTHPSADPMADIVHEPIGNDGMKIDREMYRQRFATQAQEMAAKHPELRDAVAAENWPAAEAIASRLLVEKPKEFRNLVKLQQVVRSDRNPSLREILKVIFGFQSEVARREQLAAECFDKYLSAGLPDATKTRELRHIFHALVLDGAMHGFMERGEFAQIRSLDAGLYQAIKTVGPDGVKGLLAYVRSHVASDDFVQLA